MNVKTVALVRILNPMNKNIIVNHLIIQNLPAGRQVKVHTYEQ